MHIPRITNSILSAVIVGQIAAIIMALFFILVFQIFTAQNLFYPLQLMGSFIYGGEALKSTHPKIIIAGLAFHHLGPSLVWSLIYGVLAYAVDVTRPFSAFLLGLLLGALSMVDIYFLTPLIMQSIWGFDFYNLIPRSWHWWAHLIFGATFVLYPFFYKKIKDKVRSP